MATDRFGALALDPVPVPQRAAAKETLIGDLLQPAGDPLLYYVGEYLRTVINAQCGAAWAMLDPFDNKTQGPSGKTPVADVAYVDPRDRSFNARDLPALFIYRDTFPAARIGEDMWTQKSSVAVHWVPSPANLQRRSERAPFVNAIAAIINRALIRGRHPSWRVTGDPDPDAITFGSSLIGWCGCDRPMTLAESKRITVQIDGHEGEYTGLKVVLQAEELLFEDPALRYFTPTLTDNSVHQMPPDGDGTYAYSVAFGDAPPVTP